VVSIIGGSGSGKSTLLMCINGLEPIQQGSIKVDGVEVHAKATNLNQLRQKIGIVFQQWNAFPHLTVLENVMLAPAQLRDRRNATRQHQASTVLRHRRVHSPQSLRLRKYVSFAFDREFLRARALQIFALEVITHRGQHIVRPHRLAGELGHAHREIAMRRTRHREHFDIGVVYPVRFTGIFVDDVVHAIGIELKMGGKFCRVIDERGQQFRARVADIVERRDFRQCDAQQKPEHIRLPRPQPLCDRPDPIVIGLVEA
jgi:ABC-type Fe3+/spermidine/putrescine transport system ATPase subunit